MTATPAAEPALELLPAAQATALRLTVLEGLTYEPPRRSCRSARRSCRTGR